MKKYLVHHKKRQRTISSFIITKSFIDNLLLFNINLLQLSVRYTLKLNKSRSNLTCIFVIDDDFEFYIHLVDKKSMLLFQILTAVVLPHQTIKYRLLQAIKNERQSPGTP